MTPRILELPFHFFRAFGGQASLPIYELDRAYVQTKRVHIRPFLRDRGFTNDPLCPKKKTKPAELSLSGWRLAHAVKKADCLRQMPFELVQRLGFLLEQLPTLDWRRENLRLLHGVASAYADFAGSSLAGRIGQGIALLFMEARGYSFAAHYKRAAGTRGPDFVFAHAANGTNRVLVESKGAFVAPGVLPNIKGVLAEGLNQIPKVDPLGSKKSYVVGSFLRENSDKIEEPSLVAFVDPEDDRPSPSDEASPDLVLRHNYAAWLDAMGLHYAASDLRERTLQNDRGVTGVHILKLNGESYGVIPIPALVPDDFDQLLPPRSWLYGRFVVAGLPMRILKNISVVLADPSKPLTTADRATDSPSEAESDSEFTGSVMGDGSLLGSLSARELFSKPLEEIRL